jgi:hypothetical protein
MIKYLRRTTRQRPGNHGQVPATRNERRLGKTIKSLRGAAGIGLGATTKSGV